MNRRCNIEPPNTIFPCFYTSTVPGGVSVFVALSGPKPNPTGRLMYCTGCNQHGKQMFFKRGPHLLQKGLLLYPGKVYHVQRPQHFLNLRPLPQAQGLFRPTFPLFGSTVFSGVAMTLPSRYSHRPSFLTKRLFSWRTLVLRPLPVSARNSTNPCSSPDRPFKVRMISRPHQW